MTVQKLAEAFRVAAKRDSCGDQIVAGKNGHLWCEGGQVFACFTDDGRKRPLTSRAKVAALRTLGLQASACSQEGDAEFTAKIPEGLVPVALKVLGVRKHRVDWGVTRSFGPKPVKSRQT